jgi:hypothetical protein
MLPIITDFDVRSYPFVFLNNMLLLIGKKIAIPG